MLAVDANIILSVALGRRSRPLFDRVLTRRTVVTSARAADEIRSVLRASSTLPRDAGERAEAVIAEIQVVGLAAYADFVDAAARALAQAVASRNGSTRDAHLLACAWAFDADIWTHDRDFAGTGWASWSNANLSDQLGPDPT
jgi:predicted nucleic acid-binding protein